MSRIPLTQLDHRQFKQRLQQCRRCPRLTAFHDQVREQYPDYHAAPVGSWGADQARGLIVGLAPGLHGAARTGRAFVGDTSGQVLFTALYRQGLSTAPDADRSQLNGIRITNVVKCLPPGNAPTVAERNQCADYLSWELNQLTGRAPRKNRVILCLGGFAHRALYRALGHTAPTFAHGVESQVAAKLWVISSFHPSRLNLNTGRITPTMVDQVVQQFRLRLHHIA